MSHPSFDHPHLPPHSTAYSPALLALKRFVRGTLRQFGMGLIALMVMLNISAHLGPELAPFASDNGHQGRIEQTASPLKAVPVYSASSHSASSRQQADEHFYRLSPRMTHHHLTSSRLSIPTETPQTTLASLIETAQ